LQEQSNKKATLGWLFPVKREKRTVKRRCGNPPRRIPFKFGFIGEGDGDAKPFLKKKVLHSKIL